MVTTARTGSLEIVGHKSPVLEICASAKALENAGEYEEARVWFAEAASRSSAPANKLRILVNSTIVEVSDNRPVEALSLLDRAAPLLEIASDDAVIGRYHMQRGLVLRRLGGDENLDLA